MREEFLKICIGELKQEVLLKLDCYNDIEDEKVLEWIDEAIIDKSKNVFLTLQEKKRIRKELFNALRKLDVLQELVDCSDVTEIMINGAGHIFIEKNGQLLEWNKHFETKEKLWDVIQQIVSKTNRVVNEASPIVDTRLDNGSRVNVVLQPIALNGPIVTIRRFPDTPITMEKLIELGSIDESTVEFLHKLVKAKYNIFISGGTGSGKTTFLNALSEFIGADERIVTIEDAAELQIRGVANLVRLETRNANSEGKNEVNMRQLIKTALRMRPDRIIIGEVRGAECVELLQAMNTGHDGSISTGHANSAKDMLSRLEMMVLMGMDIPLMAVQKQIAAGIDIIVHLGRIKDKSRKLLEVVELQGFENGQYVLNTLVKYQQTEVKKGVIKGEFIRCGQLKNNYKLVGEKEVEGQNGL